jgi:hypothetical protein
MKNLIISIFILGLFLAACGVKLKNFDMQDETAEVRISEDAGIRAVCIQWFEMQSTPQTYQWKCSNISDLRKILFPKAGVW